ncbi:hypothetical protein sos41_18990 [Alphaproteobacteria bacterium SO-S41]|nr:hypothetical protein sos41_18990 [Alphaproteobacteria bacterium SO-S41]
MAARDPASFIQGNLQITETPGLPGLRLYTAHPGSGLSRLAEANGPPPYWAYRWAGGMALAHHVTARPEVVRGKRVLDFGAGSGLVAIATARSGAAAVWAAEIDPYGVAAIDLNAALNGVSVEVPAKGAGVPPVDLVLAGDVFYAPDVGRRILPVLERWVAAGIEVLVGDPGRADLPLNRLERLAAYDVTDAGGTAAEGVVFALQFSR